MGPRWYSTYEMACNMVKMHIEGEELHAVPYGGVSDAELKVLRENRQPLNQAEAAELIECGDPPARAGEPARDHQAAAGGQGSAPYPGRAADSPRRRWCWRRGSRRTSPCRITATSTATRWPGSSTTFDHPRRLRLIYLLASYLNQVAWHQSGNGDVNPVAIRPPSGADRMTAGQLLDRVEACGVCAGRAGVPGLDAGLPGQCRRPCTSGAAHRAGGDARSATIRTTRKSPSAC